MYAKRWLAPIVSAVWLLGAPGLVWASEGGGGLINVDKSLLIQALNFAILLFVLHRLLYKPLLAKMEERTHAIKASLDEAQAARAEAAAIREQALKDTAEEQRRLLEAARAESQRMIEAAKAQLDSDVRKAREELRREVSDLAVDIAEKLIRKSLRDEDHRRIVDDAIASIGRR